MTSTAPARKDPAMERNEERIAFLRVVVLLLGLAVGMLIPVEILLVPAAAGKRWSSSLSGGARRACRA